MKFRQNDKPITPSEHEEQARVVEWAAWQRNLYPELAYLFAIPNGAKLPYKQGLYGRYSPEAIRLKAEGMQSGVPDMMLPVAAGPYHGLFMELKRTKGGEVADSQWKWLEFLESQGYQAAVCYGADETIEVITRYLELRKRNGQ